MQLKTDLNVQHTHPKFYLFSSLWSSDLFLCWRCVFFEVVFQVENRLRFIEFLAYLPKLEVVTSSVIKLFLLKDNKAENKYFVSSARKDLLTKLKKKYFWTIFAKTFAITAHNIQRISDNAQLNWARMRSLIEI